MILAIAMLLSLLPTIPLASATETPTEFTVDFAAYTSTFPDKNKGTKDGRWYIFAGDDIYGENWKIITDKTVSTIFSGTTKTAVQHYTTYLPINVTADYAANGWDTLAIEVTAPSAGMYTVDVIGRSSGSGVDFSASVNDTDIGEWSLLADKTGVKAGGEVTLASAVPVVLEKGANTVKIKQTVGQNGYFGFNFTPFAGLGEVSISAESSELVAGDEEGLALTVSAKDADGKVISLDNASITYKSSDEAVATVSQKGVVMPVAQGNVKITATVTLGGVTKEAEFAITVLPAGPKVAKEFILDFTKVDTSTLDGQYAKVNGVAKGPNWSIITKVAEGSNIFNKTKRIRFYLNSYLQLGIYAADLNEGYDTVLIDFDVPADGTYYITGLFRRNTAGGYGDIYIDGNKICTYDFYNSANADVTADVSKTPVALTEGTHRLRLTGRFSQVDTHAYVNIFNLTFTPLGEFSGAELSLDKNYILLSDTDGEKLSVNAIYESGCKIEANNVGEVTFESLNTDVATVTADGTVIPVSEGEVTIKTTVTIGEVTKEAVITLTISKEPLYKSFKVDFAQVDTTQLVDGQYLNRTATAVGPNWQAVSNKNTSTLLGANNRVRFYSAGFVQMSIYSSDRENGRDTLVVNFTVPEDGVYDVTGKFRTGTSGGYGDIYIDGVKHCRYDFYADAVETVDVLINSEPLALTKGEHQFKFTGSLSSAESRSDIFIYDFTFTEEGILDSAKLAYDKRYILLSETNGAKLDLSAKYVGGRAVDVAKDAVVSFKSSDEAIATVSQDGVVFPVSEGSVVITATVNVGGIIREAELPLKISAEAIYENFDIDFTLVDRDKLDDSDGRVNRNGTAIGPNWSLVTDRNVSTVFGANNRVKFYATYLQFFLSANDVNNGRDRAVVKFDVGVDALYDIELFGGVSASGGLAEFYIDNKYVGEYDFYSEITDTTGARGRLRAVELSKGTHTLTVVVKPSSGTSAYVVLSKLSFEEIDALSPIAKVGAETSRDSIAQGESEPYSIYILHEDGVRYYAKPSLKGEKDISVSLSSDTPEIASVSDGFIKALNPGNAEFTISGDIAGVTVPNGEFEITVNENTYDHPELDVVYDLFYEGGTTEISAAAYLSDGSKIFDRDITYHFASDNTEVASIDGNTMSTLKEGEATITAYVTFNGIEKTVSKKIKVVPVSLERIEAHTEDNIVSSIDKDGSQIVVKGINNDGSEGNIDGATYVYENLTPDLIDLSEDGKVFSIARGAAQVKVIMTLGGLSFECIADVISSSQKTEPTLYTYEMRQNALYNISKYDWAKSSKDSAVRDAEYWVENLEAVYDSIMYEGIPRAYSIGLHDSPDDFDYKCAYCQEDVRNHATSYGWKTNPLVRPFKIQCPACKRFFPSNDFESFYKLGLDQKRQFDRTRALEAHRAMLLEKGEILPELEISEERRTAIDSGLALTKEERAYYGYGKGYLKNNTYRDAVNDGVMLLDHVYDSAGNIVKEGVPLAEEDLDTYAVDDGMGWNIGLTADSGIPIMKTFIPFYHHAMYSINGSVYLTKALPALMDAYLYTGDIKYGRAGAILIDRIADVFPSFDLTQWVEYQNSHGGRNTGKILGAIWQSGLAETFIKSYDAFYPAMDDPYVIQFLSKKAAEFGLENPKLTGDMIRENCENGIVRESFKGAKEDKIQGNFGMHQMVVTCAAVALDTFPETQEMLDWLMARSSTGKTTVSNYGVYVDGVYKPRTFGVYTSNTGGEIGIYLVNQVDRDGFGYEIGASYNQSWLNNISDLADILYRYKGYNGTDFYEHPKFKKMFNTIYQMTMAGGYTLHLGDFDRTASVKNATSKLSLLRGFKRLNDPLYGRILAALLGGTLTDAYIDIFEPDAEAPKKEIEAIVEEQGEYKLGSRNLPGFGLAVLSGGELIKNSGAIADADFRHDTWLWYGNSTKSHGHEDLLQMGIDAYGFNFTPDLGYPKETGSDPNRAQWVSATISHNTVVVNGKTQKTTEYALPYHYDGDGIVKLIDVDAAHVYDDTDIYRRTLVSVNASEEVAYTVDFFRILGGSDHMYSFHTQSCDGYTVDGLNLVPQVDENGTYIGSYAGKDVPYGEDPGGNPPDNTYPTGFTWLKNVNRDDAPASGNFSVNFKQTDFKHLVEDSNGLNLKFTALNDWTPSSVGIAAGLPPHREENLVIPHLDYMMIHRTGENLDTLYTSVIQPYKGEEYIESMESVPLTCNGTEGEKDASRAVKVKLKNGRIDYIIYATNNELTYTLNDGDVNIEFNGFVGVYSVNEEGKNIYSYINDGTKIGNLEATSRYTGKVISFTEELSSENEIVVMLDQEISDEEIAALAGEYVYIEPDNVDNASYRIEGASRVDGGITLDIGDVSLIRSYKTAADFNAGYKYNIAADRSLYIPLSAETTNKPVIAPQSDASASAGSVINVQLSAKSADDEKVTYIGNVLPRGASIDSETGIISWKPTSSQIGENGFLVTVRDESGRENAISFIITVHGSTTGTKPVTPSTPSEPETPGTSAGSGGASGGGGGGGGGATAPTTPSEPEKGDTTEKEDVVTPIVPETPSADSDAHFVDLEGHSWAVDAINALAEDNIIKGPSETTFSPAKNITRADFAILLVRAFKLESENAENFADVADSDYFAKELAIARNTGIVGGIGDNKYAPKNNITRQDMMVIVYRALKKLNVELEKTTDAEMTDVDSVADYAKEAVGALISAGLVNGKNGKIAPKDYTTRAEVAVLIKRILDYMA
ncbi:MAG: S-layer homology domain-containing protein [Oscillospiraceae bacterium]|nr:S-layer homology domain-containing protein [Oscillospiraceae bacterium]